MPPQAVDVAPVLAKVRRRLIPFLFLSIGNTGGFVGPYLLGALNDATHSFAAGLIAIAAMLAAGGVLVLAVDDDNVGVTQGS